MENKQEIRCNRCNRLLAIEKDGVYEIKSKHDAINVAFVTAITVCKCGLIYKLDHNEVLTNLSDDREVLINYLAKSNDG